MPYLSGLRHVPVPGRDKLNRINRFDPGTRLTTASIFTQHQAPNFIEVVFIIQYRLWLLTLTWDSGNMKKYRPVNAFKFVTHQHRASAFIEKYDELNFSLPSQFKDGNVIRL